MFEYELKFDSPVDSRHERFKLVNQLKEIFGPTKTFDGVCLYLYCTYLLCIKIIDLNHHYGGFGLKISKITPLFLRHQ